MHGHGRRSVTKIPEAITPTHSFSYHSLWLVPRSPSPDESLNNIFYRTIRRVLPLFDDNAGFGAMGMYFTIQFTAPRMLFDSFNQVLSHGRMNEPQ